MELHKAAPESRLEGSDCAAIETRQNDVIAGRGIVVTFGGSKGFAALRPDQQVRVSDMMLSWHRVGGFWYCSHSLRRAIRKVLNNYP